MITLNEKGKREDIAKVLVLFIAAYILFQTMIVYAAETSLFTALQRYEIDSTTDIFTSGGRTLGFFLMKGLGKMADALYDALTFIYKSLDITYNNEIGALVKKYSYLYKLLFTVAFGFFCLYLIGRQNQGQLNTLNCIMLIFLVVAALPLVTEKLAKLTEAGTEYVQVQWTDNADSMKIESLSATIMKDYIIDLEKVDENIDESNISLLKEAVEERKGYNSFTNGGKEWRYIDITEGMDYTENNYKNSFWDKKLEVKDGETVLIDLSTWIPFMDKYYYRYQLSSWIEPGILLAVLCIVFLFSGFRCAILIIGIVQAEIYLPFIAVTDLASGQRIKEGLKGFIVLFAGIFLSIALLGVYFVCYKIINVHIDNVWAQIIMHLALAWKVIDGPSDIERILGVDVGAKDGWKIVLGLSAVKSGSMAAKTAAVAAGKAITSPVRAAGAIKDKATDANEAMNKMKGRFNQASQKRAEAKEEASKWKPAAAENKGTDPMNRKDEGERGEAGSGGIKGASQNESAQGKDPMEKAANNEKAKTAQNTVQKSDPMANRARNEQGLRNDTSRNVSAPVSNKGEPSGTVSAPQVQRSGKAEAKPTPHVNHTERSVERKAEIPKMGGQKK